MNNNYLKALDKLNMAKCEIERLWNDGQQEHKSFEDRKAYQILESLIEYMDTAAFKLNRFTLPVIEGTLYEDPARGKFELHRNGQGLGWQFSCGEYLEVYDQELKEWHTGRVEHASRNGQSGYYFYCHDMEHPFLYTGMVARIRKA